MPSPFPGIDPYLEEYWGDVHTSLTTYARDQLQPSLPEGLIARVEEYVTLESNVYDSATDNYVPDVHVVEMEVGPHSGDLISARQPTTATPLLISRIEEQPTQRQIQIVDTRTGNRVVTVIEFLSRSNKSGEASRRQYLQKQRAYIEGGVNLVEIDLLRSGSWMIAVPKAHVPESRLGAYHVCVVRAQRPDMAEVYPLTLHDPLPAVAVPLRDDDDDVLLELQPLIDQSYDNGGYSFIDYRSDPVPPLVSDQAEWAETVLSEKGLR